MSSWGSFTWGDATLYGPVLSGGISWGVEVDWAGLGVFDGSSESSRLIGIQTFRGRRSYLSTGDGFSSIETGQAEITLENEDGRFDPWNTASPLYPNVTDGRQVRLQVCDQSTGIIRPVFYGVITDIRSSNYQEQPTVVLRVEDGWRNLRRTSARVAMQENISPDVAVGLVLTAAGWAQGRALEVASDNIRYYWSSGNILAGTELERLAQSFLANFYIDAAGNARFVVRSNTTGAVADLQQADLLKDLSLAQPWENRRTITRVKTHPLSLASSITLWQLVGEAPAIVSGTDLVLWANYTYNNQPVSGKSVISPVATTDWTANASSGGGGVDKTGVVTLSFSNLGDTAKLTFRYSGGGTVYLTSAKIRGDALYEVSATDVTYPADTSTVTDPREFIFDLPWQQDVNTSVDFAAVIGPFLAGAHQFPTIKMDSRPDLQFLPDLFDIVTATIERIGIDGQSFRVAGIGHSTTGNCQRVVTTFILEPYISGGAAAWTWPILDFGVDTIFGW